MMAVLGEKRCWLYGKNLSLDCMRVAFLITDIVILPVND